MLAVIVALNILWQGWHVIGSSVDGLMDRAVDMDEHIRIRDIISANSKGALEVHDLKTRIAGRATFIEFHLVVDADMTVGESHVICDRIEEALKAEIPQRAHHHPCRAGRRGQAAARHERRAVRVNRAWLPGIVGCAIFPRRT